MAIADVAGQRTEERNQILFFSVRETKRAEASVQRWVLLAAAVLIVDHLFQSGEAAVVHIGCGPADLAKGWRFEGAAIVRGAGHASTAFIGERTSPPCDAGVVELLVS